jgi:hypothetical protein
VSHQNRVAGLDAVLGVDGDAVNSDDLNLLLALRRKPQTDYAAARSTRLFSPKGQCPFFQRIVDRRLAKHCGHSHRREAGRQHWQEHPGVVSHLCDEDVSRGGAAVASATAAFALASVVHRL